MTTTAAAQAAIRAKLTADLPALMFKWQNESFIVPAIAVPFAFVELQILRQELIATGGGRFNNLYRNHGFIVAQVQVRANTAVTDGLTTAEQIAAVFRSYRDFGADPYSCFEATVRPETGRTEDGNYNHLASAEIVIHFDQVG